MGFEGTQQGAVEAGNNKDIIFICGVWLVDMA